MLPTFLLSISTLLCLSAPSLAQTVPSQNCTASNAVHVIIGRGESKIPNNPDALNVLGTTLDMIRQRIPGSDGLGLRYDYVNEDKAAAVQDGANKFKSYIRDYVASCPKSKIVLVGYSLGAMALMDSLCGTSSIGLKPVTRLEAKYAPNVLGAITHGDEGRVPFQSYNVGNCSMGVGLYPRLNPLACMPFAGSMRSYCDQYDEQCCSKYPNNGNEGHHGYTDRYNVDAVNWLRGRLGMGPWTGK